MNSNNDPIPPEMPMREIGNPNKPIISILENRFNDIEAAFNAVIEVTQQQSYSLAQFVVAAKSGLMALSAARDFLPYLTIKGNAK